MPTVVISPCNVVNFLDGGGHFWVFLQYALGLKQLGCEVWWLEQFRGDAAAVETFTNLMKRFGLGDRFILYQDPDTATHDVFRRADVLLNFHYAIAPQLLARFRRTALVDIDPGLLQFWIGAGQLSVPRHDVYLTTGETVGTPAARFPDCGLSWRHIRPPVFLDEWPATYDERCKTFTTVSNWWGSQDWIIDDHGNNYENTKRASFLEFVELPRRTDQPLELALFLADEPHDQRDRELMEDQGWRIRHSRDVAPTPAMYQSYIQHSRGEFSCVKPSCIKFQNAWISDRTLCYLASGKPAVVQDTGPSHFLPNGQGVFRFRTIEQAAEALATINANYRRHCRAAREIVEAYFDSKIVLRNVLDTALP